ncbi:MAG TPA: protein kinase [Anaerolineae bacterium]|nr:protein kinase [Anaerolineae bacterium]
MKDSTLVGKTLGKYRVVEHSGSGGMAEVYKAYHPGLDCYVAIKVLHSFLATEEDFLTRFQREARVVATFRHPNIVQVYDFDCDVESDCYYMVMEFIDGSSLKTRLEEMGREDQVIPLDEAIRIILAVATALEYAHQHGMVHRDIKPANIMFTEDGQVILTDFGIARMVNTVTLTASGAMVGTPAYMAPEQGSRTGDERADIYSLGVVLYQLATGTLPFEADTPLGIILKHINAPLTPPTAIDPDLPPSIEAVIMRALVKDPDHRYQTAREFATDLEKCLAGEPVEPVPLELVAAPPPSGAMTALPGHSTTPYPQAIAAARPKRGWIAVLAGVLAVILLLSAALLTTEAPGRLLAALLSQAATPTPGVSGTPADTPTPDLTATYDVNATQFAVWMATYVATTGVTPTPSPNPTATATPDLTATAIAACVFDMEAIYDWAVWPTVLVPRQRFVKQWRIRNTGTCTWPGGVQLVYASGNELEIVSRPEIGSLAPGETADVKLTLRAPASYNRYTSVWQLHDGAGNPIGEELEIKCRVGPTPTPRPTETPTTTPTPAESFHFSVPFVVDWHDTPEGKWWAEVGLTAWGGHGNYRYYLNYISTETEFFNGTFEIDPIHCKAWWGTVIVTSGEEVLRWEGKIPYPELERCSD